MLVMLELITIQKYKKHIQPIHTHTSFETLNNKKQYSNNKFDGWQQRSKSISQFQKIRNDLLYYIIFSFFKFCDYRFHKTDTYLPNNIITH